MSGPDAATIKQNIGSKNSIRMTAYMKTENGKAQAAASAARNSKIMLEKIARGDFTPCVTNSRTHWKAEIHDNGIVRKFRSSWEACFWYSNQHLLYESVRIPYTDLTGVTRSYIADFFDESTNNIYEIKPVARCDTESNKLDQVKNWCLQNGIKFNLIDETSIMAWIDESMFMDENLLQLNKLKKGISGGKNKNQANH